MYSLGTMTLGPTIEAWFALLILCVAAVCTAILAGRSHRTWQRFPLLALEMLLEGAAIVSTMFEVWLIAKVFIGIGVAAATALVLAIVIGIALAALAVAICPRLVRAGYVVFGSKARFGLDFGNSLWFTRSGTWRPKDFRRP